MVTNYVLFLFSFHLHTRQSDLILLFRNTMGRLKVARVIYFSSHKICGWPLNIDRLMYRLLKYFLFFKLKCTIGLASIFSYVPFQDFIACQWTCSGSVYLHVTENTMGVGVAKGREDRLSRPFYQKVFSVIL